MVTHQGAEGRQNDVMMALSFPRRNGTSHVEHGILPFGVLNLGRSGRRSSPVVCRRVDPKGLVLVRSLHYAQIDDEYLLGVSPALGVWE